jgi:hypothetical protein
LPAGMNGKAEVLEKLIHTFLCRKGSNTARTDTNPEFAPD